MEQLKPALMITGLLLSLLSALMLIPAFIDLGTNNTNSGAFFEASFVNLIFGLCLYFVNRQKDLTQLSIKQVFIITGFTWLGMSFFAALPFVLSDKNYSLVDALFESISGITTTGATVFPDLQSHSKGLLLWRGILNWIGGIGIVVLGIVVLPFLKIGGMGLFRSESSDKMDKILPKTKQIAISIFVCYVSLNIIFAVAFNLAGMNWLDAIVHSFAGIATGGFSNYDASIGHFNSVTIEAIAIASMTIGALPFLLFVQLFLFGKFSLFKDSQVSWFLAIQLGTILIISWYLYVFSDFEFLVALRQAAFSITTIITTTGWATADFATWGPFPITLMFMILFIGGCSGSTAGSLKVFRIQVLFQMAKTHLYKLIQPHGVFNIYLNKRTVSEGNVSEIMGFTLLYTFSFMLIAVALAFAGLDFLSAMSGSIAMLANVGPGLSPLIGPVSNYVALSDLAKLICSFAMLLGRLEVYALLILLTPRFWRN